MSRRARPIGWTVALLSALLTLAAAWAVAPARAADSPRVIVSLTFDDGFGSQSSAAQILRERGMRGTFYVNSGMIGEPGRLSREQLRKLVADGHEIGGHTTDHVHLPTVDTSEELRQVCDDRVAIERLAGTTPPIVCLSVRSTHAGGRGRCGSLRIQQRAEGRRHPRQRVRREPEAGQQVRGAQRPVIRPRHLREHGQGADSARRLSTAAAGSPSFSTRSATAARRSP